MTSPAQLAQVVSEATGVPLATIVDIDRRLAKAELRVIGGRGFNVARMKPLDAARLLTALLGSATANASAEAVTRYVQTRIDKARSSDGLFGAAKLDDLAALPIRHSFVDALAALITSASTGALARLIAADDERAAPSIEVFAFTRATRGRIRIAGLPSGLTASVEYIPSPATGKAARATGKSRKNLAVAAHGIGDLEQSRRISERSILPIAKLLADGGGHE